MINIEEFEAFTSLNNLAEPKAAAGEHTKKLPVAGGWDDLQSTAHSDLPDNGLPVAYLPSNYTTTRESATELMEILAPVQEIFVRGENFVVLKTETVGSDEVTFLKTINQHGFRSVAEKHTQFRIKSKEKKKGALIDESPRLFSSEHAVGIMACEEAIKILPEIRGLVSFPPMRADGSVQAEGYDPKSGILVTTSVQMESPSLPDSAELLRGLLRDWKFATPADESRVMAALLAPMLRLGIWQGERVVFPIFIFEADLSQTGKGFLTKLIGLIYHEIFSLVAQPNRGVGSFDESLGKALLRGRPLICLDNLRGKLDSPILESFTTASGKVHARALRADGEVDSRYYVLYATSNGIESTQDIANRMCVTRLLHQPRAYQWHQWPEGSLLKHVEKNRGLYLGAICTILREWIDRGSPSIECHHDQREWAGAMNWIVQEALHLPPLMEGHEEIQKRAVTPGYGFLREIALVIKDTEKTLTAAQIVDLAQTEGIPLPGWKVGRMDENGELKHMGTILGKCFAEGDVIDIEGTIITRSEISVSREDGQGSFQKKTYTFRKEGHIHTPIVRGFKNLPEKRSC